MSVSTQGTGRTTIAIDSGRKPIRESPLLEGSGRARLLRDLVSGDGRVSSDAARTIRHRAAKKENISELFQAIGHVLASGDTETVRNLLWAVKYAKENGVDISALEPTIYGLRSSQDGVTSSMAGWFGGGPST
ncbi:MAG: hypothetical protein PHQ80_01830 [Candidatus ainarchaeum sp.]|nr:hypothetical protein [Candidatus ainarchaeum sp.]MDD5096280.1 hypothetical protein [Candidatus ainarchaeum sp.]